MQPVKKQFTNLETEDALLLGVVFLRSGGDPSERVLLVDLATGSLLKDSTDKPRFFSGTFELLWKIKVRQKLKVVTLIAYIMGPAERR